MRFLRNTYWVTLILLALIACSEKAASYPPILPGQTVLALGDSLTYGTGALGGEDYPTQLEKTTRWKIINAGVPGDRASDALGRLPALVELHQPKLLLVTIGGNDLLHQSSTDAITEDIRQIISMAKQQGAQVVLIAIPAVNPIKAAVGGLSDHPLYQAVADEMGIPLIQDVFSEVLSDPSLKSDQIHPNAKGYAVVAEQVLMQLRELGFAGK